MNFKNGASSTASVDNLDVDTKTTLLHYGLLLYAGQQLLWINTQQLLIKESQEEKNSSIQGNDKLKKLPTWYTEVKPFNLPNDITMPHARSQFLQYKIMKVLYWKTKILLILHGPFFIPNLENIMSVRIHLLCDLSFKMILSLLQSLSISLMFLFKLLTFWIPDKQQLLTLTNLCTQLQKEFNGINLRW